MRYTCDIETACGVADCPDAKKCDHALIPHKARITLIGFLREDGQDHGAFRTVKEAQDFLNARPDYTLAFQNGPFDIGMLSYHGLTVPLDRWTHDSMFMAAVSLTKVPGAYLAEYAARRTIANESLPAGFSHRAASQYSLKVMAPYFLDVPPFWETPDDHSGVEYNLKDLEYTGRLVTFFAERLEAEGLSGFYHDYQMPWARQLLQMSLDGVKIDLEGLARAEAQSEVNAAKYKAELDLLWAPAYQALLDKELDALRAKYDEMTTRAIAKAEASKAGCSEEKRIATQAKYIGLFQKAAQKLPTEVNLGSTAQLSWILRDYFGLDIRDWQDDESTAKAVIQKLIREGRKDLQVFLDWRTESKRLTAFYPTYKELQRNGRLHTSYNPTGARTGRISSSRPNLQQCPALIRSIFVPTSPDKQFAVFDMSAIEPRLLAYYSEDETLCNLLESGADFHGFNTRVFFGLDCEVNEVKHKYPHERKVGKEAGLSILYGAGAKRLQNIALKYGYEWGLDECKAKIAALRGAYPGWREFKRQLDLMAEYKPVVGYYGQKYAYPDHDDIYMKAANSLIQGSASQIVVDSAVRITKQFKAQGIDGRVLLVVHDELVVEIPRGHIAAVEIIKQEMTSAPLPTQWGNVRLEVEGGVFDRWEK